MRHQILLPLLLVAMMATFGCASKNMVTIPPYQQFILGENEPGEFKVRLTNTTPVELTVATKNAEGTETSGFGFAEYGTVDLVIPAGEMAVLQNKTGEKAVLEVRLYESVEGMRYEGIAGMAEAAPLKLDTAKLAALNGPDWAGSLTYRNYSDNTIVTIPVKMEIKVN